MNYKSNNSFYIFVTSEIGEWGDKTPDPPIKKDPGDYVKMPCKNAPRSAPPGVFKWYTGPVGRELILDERLFIDAEGSIILQSN